MRNILALFIVVLGVGGCTSPPGYRPANSPRIAYVPDGYYKDGKRFPRGLLNEGVEEVVQGNPRAEAEARTGNRLVIGGLVIGLAGLATEVTGLVLAEDTKASSNVRLVGVGLLAGGLITVIAGGPMTASGNSHLDSAINIYNDDVSRAPPPRPPLRKAPASAPVLAAVSPESAPAVPPPAPETPAPEGASAAPVTEAPTMPPSAPVNAVPAPSATNNPPAIAPPPPAPCRCVFPRSAYLHDGYYQRVSAGLEYTSLWGHGPSGSASISGPGSSLAFSFGATPWDGIVLGATFGFANGGGTFKGAPAGATGRASATATLLGVFVDWFPVPKDGWHVGGSFGLGGYSASDYSGREYGASAPAGSIFGGYDEWIGPQYSLGIAMVASMCGMASATDYYDVNTGYRFMAASLGLQTSLLWH